MNKPKAQPGPNTGLLVRDRENGRVGRTYSRMRHRGPLVLVHYERQAGRRNFDKVGTWTHRSRLIVLDTFY